MIGGHSRASSTRTAASCCHSFCRPLNAAPSRPSIPTRATFEATSTWRGMVSVKVSIAISSTRCPASSAAFERRSIRISRAWPTSGTAGWESPSTIPTTTRHFSNAATRLARLVRRRSCCGTFPATTTASTRISTAISHSRSRSRLSSRSPAWTSQVASLS